MQSLPAALPHAPRGPNRIAPSTRSETERSRALLPTDVLDAVRGLAASYVVLFHARYLLLAGVGITSAAAIGLPGPARLVLLGAGLTRYGPVAVLAFFLISGYAIHYRQAYRLAARSGPVVSWTSYAKHRLRRLYPPLLAALVITLVLDSLGSHLNPGFYTNALPVQHTIPIGIRPLTLPGVVGTLLFVQGFVTPILGSNSPLWSLAYEGFFYVTYPLVLGINKRLGPLWCLATFMGLGLSAAILIHAGLRINPLGAGGHGLASTAGALALVAYWPAWVAGAFIADARAGRVWLPARWWNVGAGLGVGILGGLALALPLLAHRDSNDPLFDVLWVAGLFGPLGWLVANGHSPRIYAALRAVTNKLVGLGTMSYSLYVVHLPVIALLSAVWLSGHRALPVQPWLAAAGILAAFGVAFAVHLMAERPFLSKRTPG